MRSIVLAAAVSSALISGAAAADPGYMADPIYDSPMFNFDGFYAGIQLGGAWFAAPGPGIVGTFGGVAGANFGINDALLAGVEFQANGYANTTGFTGYDALFLGHVGGYITDSAIIYAAVGGGFTSNLTTTTGAYAIGGGLEAAFTNNMTARVEILGLGPWIGMPNEAKGTLGLVWHVN